jgi:hypothetical protein
MQKQESEIKPLDREELLQRLEVLAERNPEGGAVLQLMLPVLMVPINNVRIQSLS